MQSVFRLLFVCVLLVGTDHVMSAEPIVTDGPEEGNGQSIGDVFNDFLSALSQIFNNSTANNTVDDTLDASTEAGQSETNFGLDDHSADVSNVTYAIGEYTEGNDTRVSDITPLTSKETSSTSSQTWTTTSTFTGKCLMSKYLVYTNL